MSKRKKNPWKGIDRELRFKSAEKRMKHLRASEMREIPAELLTPVFKDRVDMMSMIRILCSDNYPSTRQLNYWSRKFREEGPMNGKFVIGEKRGRQFFEFDPFIYLIAIGRDPDENGRTYLQDLVTRGLI